MRVVISGGGTGGHIYPALSIIREIRKQQPASEFLYIGTEKGLEADIVQKADIPFETIHITGFKRKLCLDNIKTIYRFIKGVRDSRRILLTFRPDIVIGTGGYVCGPVVYAGSGLGIPTLVHEQNVVPGLTNAFLSRYTDAVAISFEASANHFKHSQIVLTGNPRASEVMEANARNGRKSLGIPDDQKIILVVGGSRGAKAINEAFLGMASRVEEFDDCHFVYVTGEIHYEHVQKELDRRGVSTERLSIKPFIYNMPDVLAATDLIVNRAGASFLAEITALGLPSVLVPSPYVTNNHQEKNARWLEEEGASEVILEHELEGNILFDRLSGLIRNEQRLREMKNASAQLGKTKAAQEMYTLIHKLTQQKDRH